MKLSDIPFFFLKPIISNFSFFINVVFLLIIPTLLNVFIISPDYYIHYSTSRLFGFYATRGASFPFILFIPFAVSYILSILLFTVKPIVLKNIFKLICYVFFLSILIVDIFLLFNFKTMISPTILTLIKETNYSESSEFLSTYLLSSQSIIVYFISFLIITIVICGEKYQNILVYIFKFKYIKQLLFLLLCYFFLRSIVTICSFGELFCFKQVSQVENWYLNGYPQESNTITNIIYSFYIDYISKDEIEKSRKATLEFNEDVDNEFETNIILVIGESFSKHHSSLYGYIRKTNPLLENEVRKGNLFVFNDVISPYNVTSNVMKNLFSTNSMIDNENWNTFPIFPIVFKKAGYDVFFWDNQKTTETDISDYAIFSYIYDKEIKKKSYTQCNDSVFDYDMDLLKNFFLTRPDVSKSLIIFHLKGQHAMAERKYPHVAEYMHFTSDSIIGNYTDKQKIQICHYDNCTLYNDAVLYSIFNYVREENSVIVYLSDHGEEVHDYRNHYGRTQETIKTANILRYQYQVPFMIWCSNSYKKKHLDIIKNISNAVDKPFMIDNTCQILFSLAGIKCDLYKTSRDLISPSYKPYKNRIIQNGINYDSIIRPVAKYYKLSVKGLGE